MAWRGIMTMIIVKNSEDPGTTLLNIPASSDAHRLMGRFEGARRLDERGNYAIPANQADTLILHARANGWNVYDQRHHDTTTPIPDPIGDVLSRAGRSGDPRQDEINSHGLTLVRAVRAAYHDTTITDTTCQCGHLADHHQYRDTDGTVLVALPDETRGVICQHIEASGVGCGCTVVRHVGQP